MEDKKYSKLRAAFEATQPPMPTDFTERVMQQLDAKPAFSLRRWLWTAAAAVGLLVVVGTTTLFTRSAEADNDCVAVIYGEHTTDRAVVLAEMQKTMATLTATDGSDMVEEQLKSMFSH